MKSLLFMILLLSSMAYAESVPILDIDATKISQNDEIATSYKIDFTSGQGAVELNVSRVRVGTSGGFGYPDINVSSQVILRTKKAIEGLYLEGDKLIFHGESADTDCGTLGVSRILRRPTLYLTGNCELQSQLSSVRGVKRLQVNLLIK